MSYCTNCGSEILNNAKFCPKCGTKLNVQAPKSDRRPAPKRRMQKGVVKSLKDNATSIIKDEIKKEISPELLDEKSTRNLFREEDGDNYLKQETNRSKKSKLWFILYVVLNFLLLSQFSGKDEIMGIAFFSIIFFILYVIRRKKEKTFNWLVKIVLILQGVLAFSILVQDFEYLENGYALLEVLLLAPLTFVIIMLIFKGNKK